MTRSFVQPGPGAQTLKDLPPSSPEQIRQLAKLAGLDLPPSIMDELIASYPAFEAMVRRLPRALPKSSEPAHHVVANEKVGALDK